MEGVAPLRADSRRHLNRDRVHVVAAHESIPPSRPWQSANVEQIEYRTQINEKWIVHGTDEDSARSSANTDPLNGAGQRFPFGVDRNPTFATSVGSGPAVKATVPVSGSPSIRLT